MSGWDTFKVLVADLARPFSIYAASASGAWATVVVASKVTTAEGGALVLGVLAGWGTALYAGKAFETTQIAKQSASVEVAKNVASAAAATATAQAQAPGGPVPAGGKVELQAGETIRVSAEPDADAAPVSLRSPPADDDEAPR